MVWLWAREGKMMRLLAIIRYSLVMIFFLINIVIRLLER